MSSENVTVVALVFLIIILLGTFICMGIQASNFGEVKVLNIKKYDLGDFIVVSVRASNPLNKEIIVYNKINDNTLYDVNNNYELRAIVVNNEVNEENILNNLINNNRNYKNIKLKTGENVIKFLFDKRKKKNTIKKFKGNLYHKTYSDFESVIVDPIEFQKTFN
jgi:hypothetical protein